MKVRGVDIGVLHLFTADGRVDGELAVASSMYVIGAKTKAGEIGWDAVRRLLLLKEANFEYLDYADLDIEDLEQDLNLRVTQLINVLPQLPETMEKLQGKNTLNRIRSMDFQELNAVKKAAESAIDKAVRTQMQDFEQRSMPWRAYAMWGVFFVVSIVLAGSVWLHH
jgi:hypothetical protein